MWLQLDREFLNFDHLFRVRFSTVWKHGNEELSAELEGFVEGEIQVIARYRGDDAERIRSLLAERGSAAPVPVGVTDQTAKPETHAAPVGATTNTLHDF